MAVTRAKIALDAMGGDYAPEEIVIGAIRASQELDVDIFLVGDRQAIEDCLNRHPHQGINLTIVDAEGVVEMEEDAVVVRRKPKASINVAMNLVKEKQADAVVSAGHSGAAMAAALLRLGRLKGIDRPAIGTLFPTMVPGKSVIVLDVGANVDCKPKYLEQFALMGTVYSQYVLGVDSPKVGLLNIGEESNKGNTLALQTHELLQSNPEIPFVGNAEGRDVLSGNFDVIVCDGFVGNIVLKFAEAVGEILLSIVKEELPRGWRGKLGAIILAPNLKRIKQRVDHAEHGGALLFGVDGVCVISHGSSRSGSIFNAIRLAKEAIDNQVSVRINSSTSLLMERQKTEELQNI
ncbi:PlsX protein [Synechocystis sp. PCC 6803]|jgi:glycerol-3-phosphate acyltransferase PlsX|uniref:Phosphate acyltransferase n=1 Tax=Synechocystis sp. (strain ATCC 27184 / PCC 6803 / Kazusa) TaxID=1111708 RepID=PLSX_SYNY3|nr:MULTISPECIES: phosphate acyltransferase PlsX [unclassified Synechocystis]P73950.1 RecName: Full=Phosphate acyltransferase; AltName: Full=Acyl-ACP phosphotransacylase; AltName: Full=Acyl-[acyl-carrier-protein]--phosphate acyltransferase; AltName: Full=Phosphate-acyl-ACP acyltransferase [Synechocystis sp. PCC 6803 substr. Kazusa]BAM51775.1 glycerol-3-phosphate acyltransferase PlsX [Synechocystis sp. PCC 6803] [Bacillus subtilis BEST7613]AGF51705.1 PlsX protein [Synechocystis sp. PCC 6803]ALJ67